VAWGDPPGSWVAGWPRPCLRCGMTDTPGSSVMSTPEPYVYRLKALAKVVDVDTLDLDLDLGFKKEARACSAFTRYTAKVC
jgi:hypothetical protein